MANAKRLLIVDDSEIDRNILRNILSKCFEISEAENGYAALEIITKKKTRIDGVLLDISMPVLDGFNVLDILSENHIDIPIVLVTAEATAANVYRAAKYSIAGFISKPFEAQMILEKLANLFGIENIPAAAETHEENFGKTETYETDTYISKLTAIFKAYLRNIDMDDMHCQRVSKLMEILLVEYGLSGKTELDTLDIKIISKAAYFHDIGLMGIPTELIFKKEHMTGAEREIYESHTVMGANLIWLNGSENCKFFIKVCSDMCMHHHERYDGLGYPHGLRGSDNSVYSQLCGLSIRFDSLFIKRREITDTQFDFVINELKIDRGAFSPEFTELLSKCRGEILSYYKMLESSNIAAD
ncbi:MAG: response regulator [Huintestinicola sp.]|uniref:response regulator n=1 Tax=Huintestinicola sp. TaxID=2981661 RepID=UPI003F079C2E